jgi:hypothetical protein
MHTFTALGPPTHASNHVARAALSPAVPMYPADTWEWPVLLHAGFAPRTRHTLSTPEGGTQRMCAGCIVH